MIWTQRRSKNYVQAKARKRLNPPEPPEEHPFSTRRQRTKSRITIQIRDHFHGDSLTLSLKRAPWPNRWVCEHGEFSSAHLGKAVRLILQSASL